MAVERTVRLSLFAGLHGRPGVLLVDLARKHSDSIILLRNGEREAPCSAGIVALLSLAVGKGEEVTVRVEGKDEKQEEKLFKVVAEILHGEKKKLEDED